LEERHTDGRRSGYTPQYLSAVCDAGAPGEIVNVRLTAITKEGMSGEVVEP